MGELLRKCKETKEWPVEISGKLKRIFLIVGSLIPEKDIPN
jgi:hypothetical protein